MKERSNPIGKNNKIKKIIYCKSSVILIFDSFKLSLNKEVFSSYYLFVGKELNDKDISTLKKESARYDAISAALKLINKNYSKTKIYDYLLDKKFNKTDIAYALSYLSEHKLFNETKTMNDYVEFYNERNYGKNKIKEELIKKGFNIEEVNAITFINEDEELKASNLVEKVSIKFFRYNNANKRKHAFDYYIRQGFDYIIANKYAQKVKFNTPKEESNKLESDYKKAYNRYEDKYQDDDLFNHIYQYLSLKGYDYDEIKELWRKKDE